VAIRDPHYSIFVTNQLRMRRDVFQAIADPTRRKIIGMIAHESLNLNAVADHFNISRPAISRHIKILTECGLINIKKQEPGHNADQKGSFMPRDQILTKKIRQVR